MSETIYVLRHPVKMTYAVMGQEPREETVTELKIRRPTGKDMLLIDQYQNKPMELVLNMIVALSGQTSILVERLDAADVGPLAELAFANVEGGPKTGGIA